MKKNVSICDAVNMLNELIECDQYAIESLFEKRITCNPNLVNHPTCQVFMDNQGFSTVGFLGILNAIFGVNNDNSGYIAACYDNETSKLLKFIELKDEGES